MGLLVQAVAEAMGLMMSKNLGLDQREGFNVYNDYYNNGCI